MTVAQWTAGGASGQRGHLVRRPVVSNLSELAVDRARVRRRVTVDGSVLAKTC